MGTGEYVCVRLRGQAPWGFRLRQNDAEPHHPLQVYQVDKASHASLAGLCENDELVSVNGEPSSTLSLSEAVSLIEASTDSLQLLVKRCCSYPQESYQSISPTFRVPSPYRHQDLRELYVSESQDEAYFGGTDSEAECSGVAPMVRTQFCIPVPKDRVGPGSQGPEGGDPKLEITPGSMVELQLSLSKTTLEDTCYTSLGCARGVEGTLRCKTNSVNDNNGTPSAPGCSVYIPRHDRKPLAQRGVLISSPPTVLGQVEVVVQPAGRSSGTAKVGACGAEEGTSEGLDCSEREGGQTEKTPFSTISFGIASEEGDSESEKEHSKPSKHRPRHARLRRSESLSEKQVKEAKSKCKRIALLLTAAAPNPNNKGLLMFKKHRQRAKQYTLISYGTGENEPEFDDEEAEEDSKETHAVEVTVLATSEAELDEDFFTIPPGHKSIVTFDWDTGLLEIERKINSQEDMNTLPETKGKGALMFAQRRQRIDEIAAEHEELRRKGIPVEGVQEPENHYQQVEQQSYMQATESQNYMDVNVQHQHYQQYQDHQQQYYQQQQHQYQEYQQQMQYQQQQQHYQQQQEYEQQQQYQQHQQYQQQQQVQSSHNLNGMSSVMQSSVMNRSAKPFSVENRAAAPFTSSANQEQSCYSAGQGEQIASRDERISVPAIKTGVLQDRKKTKAKPMFSFKEHPKVSPNPELLNLLNRGDRKPGFESGPEEDYLSLGAEACNFLQSPKTKHKVPPPVAPKPHINPASPPWSPQPEIASQQFPQHAENNVPATAGAPGPEADPAPNIESSAIPKQNPSPTPAPERQEAITKPPPQEELETVNAWGTSEPQMQPNQQPEPWSENQSQQQLNNPIQPPQVHAKEPPASSWGPSPSQAHQQPPVSAWVPSEVQSQPPAESQMQPLWVKQPQLISDVQPSTIIQTKSQTQPPWVTRSPPQPQNQPQPQPQINSWATAPTQSPPQPPWVQPQMPTQQPVSTWSQDLNQTQGQPPWAQQQQQSQPLPPWTGPQQSPQNPWAQPQSQPQPQPPWMSQNQQQALSQTPVNVWTQPQNPVQAQPPWVQQVHPPPQSPPQMQQPQGPWPPQSQWGQPPQEHPQQMMNSWAPEQNQIQPPWTQPQLPAHTQTSWSQQPQQQASPPSQTLLSTWTPQPQQGPVSITASDETQKLPQPIKPWSPPQNTQPPLPQRMNSYTPGTKLPSPTPMSNTVSLSGMGSAFEMPALRGKGAELFAKRQSRMEKYVVDSASVQANKARPSSPSPSLPTSWKYSATCRAPPPLTYNPIHSPSYPPGAIKQPPSSSPSLKNKNKGKEKDKPAPKPLHVLDVMKHQPYQLNASLFTYGPAAEKLAAEKEAAEKLAAQKAAEAQAQAQTQAHIHAGGLANQNQHLSYDQAPAPYGFMPQHPQPPQQHYGMSGPSSVMHDGPYHHTSPNNYQPSPNPYQQAPYQQMYSPQQVYQQPPSSPYQQASNSSYQQPPPYEAVTNPPYSAVLTPCYQPASSSYVVPTFPVVARADSTSGSSILTAPKPKFSANKSAAQVWKPNAAESVEK